MAIRDGYTQMAIINAHRDRVIINFEYTSESDDMIENMHVIQ